MPYEYASNPVISCKWGEIDREGGCSQDKEEDLRRNSRCMFSRKHSQSLPGMVAKIERQIMAMKGGVRVCLSWASGISIIWICLASKIKKKNPIPKAIPVIRAIGITAVGGTEELLALRLTEEDGIKPDLIRLLWADDYWKLSTECLFAAVTISGNWLKVALLCIQ